MTAKNPSDKIGFMVLYDDNNLKKKSLNDNVYYTLRDIFANGTSMDIILKANMFIDSLTNGVYFEDRKEDFIYTNVLNDKKFVESLLNWLKMLYKQNIKCFDCVFDIDKNEVIDENRDSKQYNYIKFDVWFGEFEKLINSLNEEYEKCCMMEEEMIQNI